MSMQAFFEGMARDRAWSPALYEGGTDLRTYNFVTRRECVARLLRPDGPFRRALDVGCGTGDYAPVAHEKGASFHGIDFSRSMIAQAIAQDEGDSHYVTGSGETLPYADGSFDLVLALGYIEYFQDPGPAMRELRRVLQPGGTLVIQSFKHDLFGTLEERMRSLRGLPAPQTSMNLPSDWVDKKYSRRELDRLVVGSGFQARGGLYNNFYVFPRPLRVRRPRLYVRLSEAIGRTCPGLFGFLAVNYIAKYVRV